MGCVAYLAYESGLPSTRGEWPGWVLFGVKPIVDLSPEVKMERPHDEVCDHQENRHRFEG
jgi:hypothetical protein